MSRYRDRYRECAKQKTYIERFLQGMVLINDILKVCIGQGLQNYENQNLPSYYICHPFMGEHFPF